MTRAEARLRVHKAIAAAGHVDRWDEALADLLVEVEREALAEADRMRAVVDMACAWEERGGYVEESRELEQVVRRYLRSVGVEGGE